MRKRYEVSFEDNIECSNQSLRDLVLFHQTINGPAAFDIIQEFVTELHDGRINSFEQVVRFWRYCVPEAITHNCETPFKWGKEDPEGDVMYPLGDNYPPLKY